MVYASAQDLVERHGPDAVIVLGDADDAAKVDQALDDASAEIDGYLEPRYELPLSSVPQLLVRLCVDIAFYRLASMVAAVPTADDDRRLRYQDAVSVLRRIRSGEVRLGVEALGPGLKPSFNALPRRFGRAQRPM